MRTEAGADDVEVFDFGAWLQEDRETGPTAPPSDPRVVTGAAEAPGRAPSNFRYFDFTGWLSEGETYGPVAVLEPEPDAASGSATEPAPKTSRPLLPRPSLHPVKAGTFALFLAVVALVGLTIVGDLQAVAPAAGIAP